jgi:threonine aldolase
MISGETLSLLTFQFISLRHASPMSAPGCQFASDNTAGICPEAWEALEQANRGFQPSYGDDKLTRDACDQFREIFETDCDVYFVFTGTAANSLSLASLCQSYHSVIAHTVAHVETDECGAPEFFSNGSKILLAKGEQGKCDPVDVERLITHRKDLHYPKPRALSVSQSTEFGTVYRPDELQSLWGIARSHGVHVHMDGARFPNAVASLGCSPAETTWRAGVDVLCFGGTKLGMAMTEAIVFFNKELSKDFAWRCKQAGQLASKMRFISAQWKNILKDDVWLKHARHANGLAQDLAQGLKAIPGVELLHPVDANSVFAKLPVEVDKRLRAAGWVYYNFIGGGARFMCSWKTTSADVNGLLEAARPS